VDGWPSAAVGLCAGVRAGGGVATALLMATASSCCPIDSLQNCPVMSDQLPMAM